MVVAFASLFHLILCANALVRSAAARFFVGVAGAIARIALILASFVVGISAGAFLPGGRPAVVGDGAGRLVIVAATVGPLVSFGAWFVANKRAHDAPAAREDEARRPAIAWLAVAVLDAMFVVIQVGALVMMRDD